MVVTIDVGGVVGCCVCCLLLLLILRGVVSIDVIAVACGYCC